MGWVCLAVEGIAKARKICAASTLVFASTPWCEGCCTFRKTEESTTAGGLAIQKLDEFLLMYTYVDCTFDFFLKAVSKKSSVLRLTIHFGILLFHPTHVFRIFFNQERRAELAALPPHLQQALKKYLLEELNNLSFPLSLCLETVLGCKPGIWSESGKG